VAYNKVTPTRKKEAILSNLAIPSTVYGIQLKATARIISATISGTQRIIFITYLPD
jgi:hypothetical protein